MKKEVSMVLDDIQEHNSILILIKSQSFMEVMVQEKRH